MDQGNLFNLEGTESEEQNKKQRRQKFRDYTQEQSYLFPESLNEYVGPYHIARLISTIIDQININEIIKSYKGGASAYDPRMMLKAWILGYLYRIYTSRPLEKALRENVAFMWISGKQEPDFRTLCNFRLRLNEDINLIFKRIVRLFVGKGIIKGDEFFVDHTKLEANANKHKIIWKKSVEKRQLKIEEELNQLIKKIEKIQAKEEDKDPDGSGNTKKISEMLQDGDLDINSLIDEINEKLKNKEIEKEEAKEQKSDIKRAIILNKRKEDCEEKKETLENRNSYSNTDIDATAMRMKDDSLKPGYNEGIVVENGFVVSYETSQNAADNVSFIDCVDKAIDNTGRIPESITSDGAYGSEENLEYLENKGITSYVKYNTFYQEQTGKYYEDNIRQDVFIYDELHDLYICPENAELKFDKIQNNTTATGYRNRLRVYKTSAESCMSCPLKSKCTKNEYRTLSVNDNYNRLKDQTRTNLLSKKGIQMRHKRGHMVETVFGDRKMNHKFGRFVLTSDIKGEFIINIESGIYYIMHNIKRLYNILIEMIKRGDIKWELSLN